MAGKARRVGHGEFYAVPVAGQITFHRGEEGGAGGLKKLCNGVAVGIVMQQHLPMVTELAGAVVGVRNSGRKGQIGDELGVKTIDSVHTGGGDLRWLVVDGNVEGGAGCQPFVIHYGECYLPSVCSRSGKRVYRVGVAAGGSVAKVPKVSKWVSVLVVGILRRKTDGKRRRAISLISLSKYHRCVVGDSGEGDPANLAGIAHVIEVALCGVCSDKHTGTRVGDKIAHFGQPHVLVKDEIPDPSTTVIGMEISVFPGGGKVISAVPGAPCGGVSEKRGAGHLCRTDVVNVAIHISPGRAGAPICHGKIMGGRGIGSVVVARLVGHTLVFGPAEVHAGGIHQGEFLTGAPPHVANEEGTGVSVGGVVAAAFRHQGKAVRIAQPPGPNSRGW